ncbi:MAG: GNAT family N-acetyltransferase [Chryseolinea sp.]
MSTISSDIWYRNDVSITSADFIDLLKRSTLAARRPVDNVEKIQLMLDHGNVLVTAWKGDLLIGVSRALTDFSFCCYLSDLAVDESFQKQGVGKQLIDETHKAAGLQTMLILLAAPAAVNYYPKIGMEKFPDCFVIRKKID